MDKLVELTAASRFPPGTYRFKGRQSGRYMVVDNGSTQAGAIIEQKAALLGSNGDWKVTVVGVKHKQRCGRLVRQEQLEQRYVPLPLRFFPLRSRGALVQRAF